MCICRVIRPQSICYEKFQRQIRSFCPEQHADHAGLGIYLIPGLITNYDEHGPVIQLDAILYHHPDAVIDLLFDHFGA